MPGRWTQMNSSAYSPKPRRPASAERLRSTNRRQTTHSRSPERCYRCSGGASGPPLSPKSNARYSAGLTMLKAKKSRGAETRKKSARSRTQDTLPISLTSSLLTGLLGERSGEHFLANDAPDTLIEFSVCPPPSLRLGRGGASKDAHAALADSCGVSGRYVAMKRRTSRSVSGQMRRGRSRFSPRRSRTNFQSFRAFTPKDASDMPWVRQNASMSARRG